MKRRSKTWILCAGISLCLLAGCQNRQEEAETSAGYEADEIWQPQVMYEGTIYYYQATGFDEKLPDGYTIVGEVEEVDNQKHPDKDWMGSRMEQGQKIYADAKEEKDIYVAYGDGFARFSSAPEDSAPDGTETADSIRQDLTRMVMVDGVIYYDTGRESTVTGRCGVMDGEITSTVDGTEVPEENNQSNFGVGFGYQWGPEEGTIEIDINEEWIVFERRGGAASESTETEEKTEAGQDNSLGVELEAVHVTPEGLTLICRQSGGSVSGELMAGKAYFLEREENGEWTAVEPEHELWWEDIGLSVPTDGLTEWQIDWSDSYGTLPEGRYRIGKEIMDYRAAGDYDTITCYAEFEL